VNVRIRPMTKKDKRVIMAMLKITPEFQPEEVVVAEEVIDSYLGDPVRSGYYVAVSESGNAVTGYICWGPTPLTSGTWDIYWMAVVPEQQGNGIGGLLMDYAEGEIRKESGRLAIIETSGTPGYEKTRRFHLNKGYEIICRIPDFYSPGDDKVIMQKKFS
jgi:GNAT superfamily N-acetyltransferase